MIPEETAPEQPDDDGRDTTDAPPPDGKRWPPSLDHK